MAETNPYKLSLPAADVDKGVTAGFNAYSTPGIPYGDGRGGFRTASPGVDYGFGMLQGNGPPTPSVVANLGQHYFDMAATAPPYEYICVGYTAYGFTWRVYGDAGSGFRILGRFESITELRSAVDTGMVPQPTAGDAYFIGTTPPYDVVVWNAQASGWDNIGPLGGGGGGGAASGIPPHGDEGQVLMKSSDADYDVVWGDAVPDGSVGTEKLTNSAVTAAKLAPGSVLTDTIAPGAVNRERLAFDAKCASVDNITVPVDAWEADSTFETHPFAAKISILGVSAQHSATVVFSPASGEGMAPVSRTEEGSVTIYAESIPGKDVNILSIILIPVGAISNVSGDYPVYAGTYSVTPAAGKQILDTDNKVLLSDITIEQIPVAEVSNEAGGTTISIA